MNTYNTYPTTPEQLYLDQKIRDENNRDPNCKAFDENEEARRRMFRPLSEKQKKLEEEASKKYREDQIAGYASRRFDFPQYQWRMYQDGKQYLRSSKNFNVYDHSQTSVIVGIWNEQTQRIEFVDELVRHNQELKKLLVKHNIRVE